MQGAQRVREIDHEEKGKVMRAKESMKIEKGLEGMRVVVLLWTGWRGCWLACRWVG